MCFAFIYLCGLKERRLGTDERKDVVLCRCLEEYSVECRVQ